MWILVLGALELRITFQFFVYQRESQAVLYKIKHEGPWYKTNEEHEEKLPCIIIMSNQHHQKEEEAYNIRSGGTCTCLGILFD